MMLFQLFTLLFVCRSIAHSAKTRNDWPIIGVFTQPTTESSGNCKESCLYIAASYVKYLEAAGARVVPVNYYASSSTIDKLFASLNGFFFTGGDAAFPKSAQYIFDKVVKANDEGDFTPLWGTCMGFEWLLMSATRDANILDPKTGQMDAYNLSIPLEFTENAKTSKLFGGAQPEIMNILSKQNVTMNNHHYGIYTDHFAATPALSEFFNVLSTNKDRKGDEFVSTIEAYKYPIFGTRWHPEKNSFEWSRHSDGSPFEAIDHSPDGVKATQYMANFFVEQTRRNFHSFASVAEENSALIYNFPVTRTREDFVQTYYFNIDDLPR